VNRPTIAAITVLVAGLTAACPHIQFGWDAEDMRQGKLIIERLKARDKDLNAACESAGGPIIDVYAVTERARQDAMLAEIQEIKQQGLVNRRVRVRFYERLNITYTKPDKKGAWGTYYNAENLIRDAKL